MLATSQLIFTGLEIPLFFEVFAIAAWNIWKIRERASFQNWLAKLRSDLSLLGLRVPQSLSTHFAVLIGLF